MIFLFDKSSGPPQSTVAVAVFCSYPALLILDAELNTLRTIASFVLKRAFLRSENWTHRQANCRESPNRCFCFVQILAPHLDIGPHQCVSLDNRHYDCSVDFACQLPVSCVLISLCHDEIGTKKKSPCACRAGFMIRNCGSGSDSRASLSNISLIR